MSSMDPAQIRASIEETQDDLGRNLDALSDKMNPRRAVRVRADRARGTWQKLKENIMGSASHARDASMHARDASMHGMDVGQARLSNAQDRMSAATSAATSAAGDRMRGMGHEAQQQAQGHPLAVGLVAFGLGVLASSLLPASQREQRLAGQLRDQASAHSDQLKQQATGVARQAQENLRGPASEAVGAVRSKATGNAGALRDQARSAGEDLRGQAQQTAQDVRRQ
ncbi:uncharacterized protein DUF3618 [Micromonospora pisi]|uniref:Uncharacterized protein DUF3618 n=1 Tax=Micromonospora pisi TaxID=589240 RepID=A0A495JEF2_9ACTN|nr:DUF3618 domain-containing protein [Micromonospora pisi]RKR87380.1 uncharacterized protein DUF3618 [Micromonospora pisi]